MRKINKIIVHCTATREGRDFDVKDIDRWHRQKGWKCCGYHYVVKLDGTIQAGRDLSVIGAHCVGQNRNSIGIVYVGGLSADGKTSKDTRTAAQKASLRRLIKMLKKQFPDVTVHGHGEFAKKDCPCFDVKKEYQDI